MPLSSDKTASQSLLIGKVRDVERRQAGLFDPYEKHAKRHLAMHISDYEKFLSAKDDTPKHVGQTIGRITKLCNGCGFKSFG